MPKSYNEIRRDAIKTFRLEGKPASQWSTSDSSAVDSYISRQLSRGNGTNIDPRIASLYRKPGMEAADREKQLQKLMADEEASQFFNNMWGSGGGDFVEPGEEGYQDVDPLNRRVTQDEPSDYEPSEEPEENQEAPSEEPGIGENLDNIKDLADKTKGATPEAEAAENAGSKLAPGLGKTAASAAEGAEGVGAAEAAGAASAAGAAAAGEAAAAGAAATAGTVAVAESNPVGWILTAIIIVVVVVIALLCLWGIFAQNASGLENDELTPSGTTSSMLEKACEFVTSVRDAGCVDMVTCAAETLYNSVRQKQFSDCYGFVVTVAIEAGIIPEDEQAAAVAPRAKDAITSYYELYPDRYEIIGPITSTKQLEPGDMLFNTRTGSHATIYVGDGYCECKSNSMSASLNSHGPQCSGWYSDMQWGVRLVN